VHVLTAARIKILGSRGLLNFEKNGAFARSLHIKKKRT